MISSWKFIGSASVGAVDGGSLYQVTDGRRVLLVNIADDASEFVEASVGQEAPVPAPDWLSATIDRKLVKTNIAGLPPTPLIISAADVRLFDRR